jgi:hypothetical protein
VSGVSLAAGLKSGRPDRIENIIVHRRPACHARPCLQPSYRGSRAQTRGGRQVASLRHKRAGFAENAEKGGSKKAERKEHSAEREGGKVT